VHRLDDDTIVLAATDLTNHLACEHLTQQKLAIARGARGKPRPADDPHAELIKERGNQHEREQLALLSARAGDHVDLSTEHYPATREQLERAATATHDAMRSGAPLIYQALFFDGIWQGRTDFLRRIERPSALGDYAYEVIDTKLAREVKPHFVHQLSLYNRLLAVIQEYEHPYGYVIIGDGTEVQVELHRYAALHRHVTRQFEAVAAAPAVETYPEPVSHCDICELAAECYARRVADDHLSLVANARRDQRDRLVELGLPTVAALAAAPADADCGKLGRERFDLLRHQARLQVESRETGSPTHRHLQPARAAGYAALPVPSKGDIFFDLEGDPYTEDGGIEYLWGWWTADAGYEHVWAHDALAQKRAFEAFVDCVIGLRRDYPDLHVYHYAPHERSKLRSLSVELATREAEIDDLLRGEVLVDLYSVVRHAMQVGEDSYSLKKLERHHGFRRLEKRVREGGGSIVTYEAWLDSGDPELLEAIRAYNEEDCRSTSSLRDWLIDVMRPEAEAGFGVDFDELRVPEPEEEPTRPDWLPAIEDLIEELMEGVPELSEDDDADQAERRLIANLLLYHYRESKPEWWRHFDLRGKPVDDLVDDRDAIAGLVRDETFEPRPYKKSLDYRFTFPPQEFRLDKGDAVDPTTEQSYNIVELGDDFLVLRRSNKKPAPEPVALVGGSPINTGVLRDALVELAWSVLRNDKKFAAARDLMRRARPRLRSGELGEELDQLVSATLGLDHSNLPVQGPPGTGKTHNGARMIVAALNDGKRVAVTAQSHAAIHNMLDAVEKHAKKVGCVFTGIYKGSKYASPHGLIEETDDNADVTSDFQLVGGTAWLFARKEHRQKFHVAFIDEAGQFSLADACAIGTAAENMVFLGDPQQLPQVNQVAHPAGSGASVLEHVLDGASTIPDDRGVLLTESWRMHPDVCGFVSARSYDNKLRSRDACGLRRIDAPVGALKGAGLRRIAVEHEGRSQASIEEAQAIATACRDLLGGATYVDDMGVTRNLDAEDILVVAPYNMAVRTIRDQVPQGVRVGTVDKFQGQEAPVVFYAMTCSSGDDVPRGLEFLFDAHRLNVAVSRAQCLAVLVHNPRLVDADCRTLGAMRLVDGVCAFAEVASTVSVRELELLPKTP
jgi:uncharacterized protein